MIRSSRAYVRHSVMVSNHSQLQYFLSLFARWQNYFYHYGVHRAYALSATSFDNGRWSENQLGIQIIKIWRACSTMTSMSRPGKVSFVSASSIWLSPSSNKYLLRVGSCCASQFHALLSISHIERESFWSSPGSCDVYESDSTVAHMGSLTRLSEGSGEATSTYVPPEQFSSSELAGGVRVDHMIVILMLSIG